MMMIVSICDYEEKLFLVNIKCMIIGMYDARRGDVSVLLQYAYSWPYLITGFKPDVENDTG